ncbi:MAG: hypothetical protein Kow0069_14850 [Promethearchaeota archaeon]
MPSRSIYVFTPSGVCLFDRTFVFGSEPGEPVDALLVAGFLAAVTNLAQVSLGQQVRCLEMTRQAYYFAFKRGIHFVLKATGVNYDENERENCTELLVALANLFLEKFPDVDPTQVYCVDEFYGICEEIDGLVAALVNPAP